MEKRIVITKTLNGCEFENKGFTDTETIMALEQIKLAILMKQKPKYKRPKTK